MNIVAHIRPVFINAPWYVIQVVNLYNGEIPSSFKAQAIKEERSNVVGMSN